MRLGRIALAASFVCFPHLARAATALDYYGGPVSTNALVVEVNWGSTVDATLTSTLPAFYTQILQSPYVDWLGEYDTVGKVGKTDNQPGSNQRIFPGSFGGAFTITPSITATTVTFAQVATEITTQVQNKVLPAPTFDAAGNANTIYAVDFPKGITITDQNNNASCQFYCGSWMNTPMSGKTVTIAVLPATGAGTPCAGGCGSGTDVQVATRVHSYVLLNVMTDAQIASVGNTIGRPAAWYMDQKGSISDLCTTTGVIDGYTVAAGWSNKKSACIVSDPSLPLCTGTNRPCRSCTSSDCTGTTPACETTPGNAHQTECVACTQDSDCKAPTPSCDRATDTCVAAPPADAGTDAPNDDASTVNDAGSDAGTQPGNGGGCSCRTGASETPAGGGLLLALGALATMGARKRSITRAR